MVHDGLLAVVDEREPPETDHEYEPPLTSSKFTPEPEREMVWPKSEGLGEAEMPETEAASGLPESVPVYEPPELLPPAGVE